MSSISTIPQPHDAHGDHAHGNGHNPHLAHHFDTPEQQIASGKLGMWVFLATEILMFGGLFCAYAVYRHNHPDVFEYAHKWLSKPMGAINTVVLITSSLTMAWGVRLAQLGKQRGLIITLALTIIGGYGFMAIKSIEYKTKYDHDLGLGKANIYRPLKEVKAGLVPGGGTPAPGVMEHGGGHNTHAAPHGAATTSATTTPSSAGHGDAHKPDAAHHEDAHKAQAPTIAKPALDSEYFDPNAGGTDAAKIRPEVLSPAGLAPKIIEEHRSHDLTPEQLSEEYQPLPPQDKERTYTFFQVYFLMTGLHGIHVVVGMALIFWILVRATPPASRRLVNMAGLASVGLFLIYVALLVGHAPGTLWTGIILLVLSALGLFLGKARPELAGQPGAFSPDYFAPVDIVGLYWHLVDLIWIFLFPLLYLIH